MKSSDSEIARVVTTHHCFPPYSQEPLILILLWTYSRPDSWMTPNLQATYTPPISLSWPLEFLVELGLSYTH